MPHQLISFFQSAPPYDLAFAGLTILVWLLVLVYLLRFLLRLAFHKTPAPADTEEPVSVLMIERNESDNLARNLPGWLSLSYPRYELLVVDDFSADDSISTLGLLKHQFPRLKMTGLNQETRYSQKLSRNLALKAAAHERAVFAVPSMAMPSPAWLPGINAAFAAGKEMAVGYTGLVPGRGFYHTLYRIESFFQQTQSMAFCLSGLPYVVSEENIAFPVKSYFDISGFAGKIREEYLNMELIFNRVIRRRKNAVLPLASLSLRKEIRAGKQDYRELLYKTARLKKSLGFLPRAVMKLFSLARLLLLPLLIACALLYPPLWPLLISMAGLAGLAWALILKRLQNRLKEPEIFLSSCIYGLLAPYFRAIVRWQYQLYRR